MIQKLRYWGDSLVFLLSRNIGEALFSQDKRSFAVRRDASGNYFYSQLNGEDAKGLMVEVKLVGKSYYLRVPSKMIQSHPEDKEKSYLSVQVGKDQKFIFIPVDTDLFPMAADKEMPAMYRQGMVVEIERQGNVLTGVVLSMPSYNHSQHALLVCRIVDFPGITGSVETDHGWALPGQIYPIDLDMDHEVTVLGQLLPERFAVLKYNVLQIMGVGGK